MQDLLINYLTENNLLQYADLEKKVEDIHSSYARTGEELMPKTTRHAKNSARRNLLRERS